MPDEETIFTSAAYHFSADDVGAWLTISEPAKRRFLWWWVSPGHLLSRITQVDDRTATCDSIMVRHAWYERWAYKVAGLWSW